jgi:hypothetical protein
LLRASNRWHRLGGLKTDNGLERLSQTMPHRYCRDGVGHWRCPPGERFADQFGLPHSSVAEEMRVDWCRFASSNMLRGAQRQCREQLRQPGLAES